jgi:hypothetical protein
VIDMSYEIQNIIMIKNSVKDRANEISQRLGIEDIDRISEIVALIDELEEELNEFEDIMDSAWCGAEIF